MNIKNKVLISISNSDIKNGKFTIPQGVTHIGSGAFDGCTGLTAVTIPQGVTHIGSGAFRNCTGLTAVTIPQGVTHIGSGAFDGCTGLTAVKFKQRKLNAKVVDGFLFVIEKEKTTKGIKIYTGYNFISTANNVIQRDDCYVAEKDNFFAHASTAKKAIGDLQFKIVSEKLKNDPINKDTKFTVKYYRLLTGACDFGVRNWMQKNNIPFDVINPGTNEEATVEKKPIKADELLVLLEKTNAYGLEKFKQLITF